MGYSIADLKELLDFLNQTIREEGATDLRLQRRKEYRRAIASMEAQDYPERIRIDWDIPDEPEPPPPKAEPVRLSCKAVPDLDYILIEYNPKDDLIEIEFYDVNEYAGDLIADRQSLLDAIHEAMYRGQSE